MRSRLAIATTSSGYHSDSVLLFEYDWLSRCFHPRDVKSRFKKHACSFGEMGNFDILL